MVLLVGYDALRVEAWRRVNGRWSSEVFGEDQAIDVMPLACTLLVAEIYRDPLA